MKTTATALPGLRPVSELASTRSHGERLRYMAGCRCDLCRRANTDYEKSRSAARKAGDWNGIVPADRARKHLAALSAAGVGRRQVADAAGVAESIIYGIAIGKRTSLRARSERGILAVTLEAAADHALVDAAETWKLLEELIASGFSKAHLARELGYETPALQISRSQCTVRSAHDVRVLHARRRRVPAAPVLKLLAELREEGYRPDRINAELARLAPTGSPAPDLAVHHGFIDAASADLLKRLHELLTEVPA